MSYFPPPFEVRTGSTRLLLPFLITAPRPEVILPQTDNPAVPFPEQATSDPPSHSLPQPVGCLHAAAHGERTNQVPHPRGEGCVCPLPRSPPVPRVPLLGGVCPMPRSPPCGTPSSAPRGSLVSRVAPSGTPSSAPRGALVSRVAPGRKARSSDVLVFYSVTERYACVTLALRLFFYSVTPQNDSF